MKDRAIPTSSGYTKLAYDNVGKMENSGWEFNVNTNNLIINDHPLNRERAAGGKNKANSLWFWGAGTKPKVQNFQEKTGLKGAMISAVDLLKGIAVGAGMKVCQVAGATGSIDTNFEGKAQAALDALLKDGCDFAYIHVEAPDEMGHQGKIAERR